MPGKPGAASAAVGPPSPVDSSLQVREALGRAKEGVDQVSEHAAEDCRFWWRGRGGRVSG